MASRAFIIGLAGLKVSADERAFLKEARPWGLIIFKRNVSSPEQVSELVKSFRDCVGWPAPVLVDQEGGRVQRLGPPHWPSYPPGAVYGALYDREPALGLAAARLAGHLIAADLKPLGIDVDCLPLADVPVAGADAVIGDRAYGHEPGKVAAIAAAIADGLQAGGVLPVLKHLPGHGRATADSHLALPVVAGGDPEPDLLPFALNADLPWAMTAHILFPAWDPALPATLSPAVIGRIIRGRIGFQGVLVTDDLAMRALSGAPEDLACAALAAGCDLALYCAGDDAPTAALLAACPEVTAAGTARLDAARRLAAARRVPLDPGALGAELDRLLA